MNRTFVMTQQFDKDWARLRLNDEDLLTLQNRLLENPESGDVIPGMAGARKIRIPLKDRGKRKGGRVVYVDAVVAETIFLLTAYAKNEQTDLTEAQKTAFYEIITKLKER